MKLYKNEQFVAPGKSIGVFYYKARAMVEEIHRHDFIEIIYTISGAGVHVIDGVEYPVNRGDVLFINYGSTHSYKTDDAMDFVNISFSPETVGDSLITPENAFALLSLTAFDEMRGANDGGKLSFYGNERDEIEGIIRSMLEENRAKSNYYGAVMQSYMNILIVKMLRKVNLGADDKYDGIWKELSNYIDDNLDTRLTLDALAKKCFYNPSYFSRIFKEKFGVSFKEYVTRRRIDYAAELLEQTELSVDEVWATAGFSDRSSFYQLFSKYTDSTPSDYRKIKKAKK